MNRHQSEWLDLRRMDNMELMRQFPDKHFDLAIVDPPYGIGRLSVNENRSEESKHRRSMAKMVSSAKSWNHKKPDTEYFAELFRVSRNQIVWGANNFTLPPSEYFCVWDKHQTVPNFASAEYAWVSMNWRMPAKVFRYQIHGAVSDDGDKIHPTQKPVALYRWLLANYAKPGQKILDTHLGSGSIAIACHYARLHLTACELDEDYFAASIARIKRETAQESFDFDAAPELTNATHAIP
jgi:site-specific DNA-methyltransferase (adenine-specific)